MFTVYSQRAYATYWSQHAWFQLVWNRTAYPQTSEFTRHTDLCVSFVNDGSPLSQIAVLAVLLGKEGKEADLYSAFIEVPYTQGAQVRITQCYL